MARDFLAIQAAATEMERTWSKAAAAYDTNQSSLTSEHLRDMLIYGVNHEAGLSDEASQNTSIVGDDPEIDFEELSLKIEAECKLLDQKLELIYISDEEDEPDEIRVREPGNQSRTVRNTPIDLPERTVGTPSAQPQSQFAMRRPAAASQRQSKRRRYQDLDDNGAENTEMASSTQSGRRVRRRNYAALNSGC
jgi:hypothetical protein